jgi:hypothetical protein
VEENSGTNEFACWRAMQDGRGGDGEAAAAAVVTIPDDVPERLKPHTVVRGEPGTQSRLEKCLQLRHIAMCDVFTGLGFSTPWGRLFGGEILAQAVMAASATVPDTHHAHSLHGYFILAGQNGVPVMFSVERTRTGGSFITRTVNAKQENQSIFMLMVSFHKPEPGLHFEVHYAQERVAACLLGRRRGPTRAFYWNTGATGRGCDRCTAARLTCARFVVANVH